MAHNGTACGVRNRYTVATEFEADALRGGEWRARCERVNVTTLDAFSAASGAHRLLYLKVDVEGGEWAVLQGARRLLADGPQSLEVVVEVTPKWLSMSGVSVSRLFAHMAVFGLSLIHI